MSVLELKKAIEIVKDPWRPGEGDFSYIGLEHINENSLSLNGVGRSPALQSNKFHFHKGDILFGKLRPYFRKVVTPDFDGVCSTDIWVMRAKDGYDQRFLFYVMANPVLIAQSSGASTGTKMPRADWDFLGNTTWDFPPLAGQRSIAAVLSSLDNKIELLRKQSETLEQIAQAIFNEQIVAKEETGLPENWTVGGLPSIANFMNGIALQKYPATDTKNSFPAIKIKELNSGITDATDRISKDVPEKYIIHDGDVLFSWSGSLEVVIWQHGEGALNQHLFKVSSEKFPKWFYFFWLLHHLPNFRAIASHKATTMGHIQRHHLDDARVVIPDNATIDELDSVMNPLLNKVILNNSQMKELTVIRDLLLPKLVSGGLRVSEK